MLKRNSTYGSYAATDESYDDNWDYGDGVGTGSGGCDGKINGFTATETFDFLSTRHDRGVQYNRAYGAGASCGSGTCVGNGTGIGLCSTGYESERGLMCQPDN